MQARMCTSFSDRMASKATDEAHSERVPFMLLNASETMFRAGRGTALAAIVVAVSAVSAPSAFAQSICNAGNQTVQTWVDITASCTITGSLTITSGVVKVNFSAAPTAVLRVEGDISISGSGVLWVDGGTFEIQQAYNRHRKLSSKDDAIVILKNTKFVVNQGDGLKYLVHFASGRAKMFVVNSTLDRTSNWLLSDQKGQSMLVTIGSLYLPTEIYVKENSTVRIAEPLTQGGVWAEFADGASGTVNLPIQSDADGELVPYSWSVGRDSAGLSGVGWQLEIANAKVGLGLECHPGAQLTVNGRGVPASGEVKIAYYAGSGVQTLSGLAIGLQNRTLGSNLTLRNVELGPIAWQIYAYENVMLTIYSSILNEVGVSNGGHITVYDSIIQLGGLGSLGSQGASVAVHNSQIHAQMVEALGDGVIDVHDSAVYGTVAIAYHATSKVRFHRGAMLRNSPNACPLNLSLMLDPQGIPKCNPFLAPGAAVTRAGNGIVTCDGTDGCSW